MICLFPHLMYLLCLENTGKGTYLRDLFLQPNLSCECSPRLICSRFRRLKVHVSVGGRNKKHKQIQCTPNVYIVKDDNEQGNVNVSSL